MSSLSFSTNNTLQDTTQSNSCHVPHYTHMCKFLTTNPQWTPKLLSTSLPSPNSCHIPNHKLSFSTYTILNATSHHHSPLQTHFKPHPRPQYLYNATDNSKAVVQNSNTHYTCAELRYHTTYCQPSTSHPHLRSPTNTAHIFALLSTHYDINSADTPT